MKRLLFIHYLFFSILFYSTNNFCVTAHSSIPPKVMSQSFHFKEFPKLLWSQEGFCADTLVKIVAGYRSIQECKEGDTIVDCNNQEKKIVSIAKKFVKQYVRLVVNDIVTHVGCDQQYCVLPEHTWMPAKNIKSGDFLLTHTGECCNVTYAQLIERETLLYSFTVEDHLFCIAPHDICVHNAEALMLGASTVCLGYITTINPILATIGAATALSAVFYKTYQEYIEQCSQDNQKLELPINVLCAERSYYEQRKTLLEDIKQELLGIKNDLMSIKVLCNVGSASFTYQFLQQNATPNTKNQHQWLKISTVDETRLSDNQKIDLRNIREAELNSLEQDIIGLQAMLALHCNTLIEQVNVISVEYETLKEQTNAARVLWNKNAGNVTDSIALQLYKAEILAEHLLTNLNQKITELKAIGNCYRNYTNSSCLKESTNIIDFLETVNSAVAQRDQELQKAKAAIAYNMSAVEQYFAHRGISVLGIKNEIKNVLEKAYKDNAAKTITQVQNKLSSMMGVGGPYKDPKKDDEPEKDVVTNHPHGIYKDAPYHHKNSTGNKSPAPKDGQRCLDCSLPTQGTQRIAIEGDTFVVLKYTSPRQFHGYVTEWKKLEGSMQSILIKNGFVTKSGKIIKQITEKVLT
jgi:Tfp pilus assembly protein PilE